MPLIPVALALAQQFASSLIAQLTGPNAGAVAQKVVDIAQAATGTSSPSDAVKALQADSQAVLAFQKALLDQKVQLEQIAAHRAKDNAAPDVAADQGVTARMTKLETTAADLKGMPILGPAMLFLRGSRRAALLTVASQVGIQLLGLLTAILVARFLGPVGRGELTAIIAWVSTLTYIGNFGLPVAYTYAAARDRERAAQLLGNGLLAMLLQWPTIVLVGIFVLKVMVGHHGESLLHLAVFYLCLYTPLNLLTLYANAIQQGLGRYGAFNAVRISVPASYLAGLLALEVFDRTDLSAVVTANLFSNFCAFALSLALLLPTVTTALSKRRLFNFRALAGDARYGLSAHLGNLQPFSELRIDVLLLSILVTTEELGLYSAAVAGAVLIKAQGFALGSVLMPEVARRIGHRGQLRAIFRIAGLAIVLGACTATIVLVWAEPLLNLIYGSAFVAAAPTLRLLVLGAMASSVCRVLSDGLRGFGRPAVATQAELASLIVGIPSISFLAPSYGAMGGAIAVCLASASGLAVAGVTLLRTSYSVRSAPPVPKTDARGAMTVSEPECK